MLKNLFYKMRKSKKNIIFVGISSLVLIGLVLIPFSFAELEPVRSVNIYSENSSYDDDTPGAWKIEKSGKWISKGTAEVTFDIDTKSMIKTAKTDVILVLDTSGSMINGRLDSVINDTKDLINNLLSSGDNRIGIIRFSTGSEILSEISNDKEDLLNKIDSLNASGETNYYSAFVNIGNMLKNYRKDEDRETIVLFVTDGLPNISAPNEVAQYNYLKSQYPWLTINGIQYEMGNTVLEQIKKISDNQFIADKNIFHNTLLEASVPKLNYEEFSITDYIDTRYFEVEKESDISVNVGKVSFNSNGQVITWKIRDLRSGLLLKELRPKMTIKAKLKNELIGKGGVYPTNSREIINTKIENKIENVDSTLTPILADNYKVKYNGNAPSGCEVSGVPTDESYSVFDTVDISNNNPTCEGYKFKGWRIVDEEINRVGSNRFIMPEEDVEVKAMWGKVGLKKSMDGKMIKVQNIYEMMRDSAVSDDEKLSFRTNNISSTSGVYQHYETKDEKFPVYYYRGEVNNNIKFADKCWKIVRTTETGGTKLIYNGLPAGDGSCLGNEVTIGKGAFNSSYNSPAYVGYKYGNVYPIVSKESPKWYELVGKNYGSQSGMTSTSYYYGDGVTYQDGVGYTLNNPQLKHWSDNYSNLGHYYTCLSTTNGVCNKVYFILTKSADEGHAPTSVFIYYVEMTNGETYESLYSEAEKVTWKFGNDVVYSGNTYSLVDPIDVSALAYYKDTSELNKVKNAHHYTCFDSEECRESVNYIYYASSTPYYITLTKGLKIEDAIKEMLTESTNENTSTILSEFLEPWYEENLKNTEYEDYIEDAIWCNDRNISDLSGWDKDADVAGSLLHGPSRNSVSPYRPSLDCVNEIDRFSVSNSKAKLDYPIGLLTADEATLAGSGMLSYSNSSYLYIGSNQWVLSPRNFGANGAVGFRISSNGNLTNYRLDSDNDVRPAIAIKPGAIITTGDGSSNSPFEITYNGV